MNPSDGCKVALLAIHLRDGSISYDTSTWHDIQNEAGRLKRSCGVFTIIPIGGNLVVGRSGELRYSRARWLNIACSGDVARLALFLYAPGSRLDDDIKAKLAAGMLVVAEEDDELGLGSNIGIVTPESLSCRGAWLASGDSTLCNVTGETVNVN